MPSRLSYPPPPRGEQIDRYFGVDVLDPFRPLENPRDPVVLSWLEDQRALTRNWLEPRTGRDALARRVGELLSVPRVTFLTARGSVVASIENDGRSEQDVLVTRSRWGGAKEVLFDPRTEGEDCSLTGVSLSPSGRLLAYGVSRAGSDWQTWHIRDLDKNEMLPDRLGPVKFPGIAWLPDESGFLYGSWPAPSESPLEAPNLGHRLMRFHLGGREPELFQEDTANARTVHFAHAMNDGRTVIVGLVRASAGRTALFTRDLDDPKLHPLLPDFDGRHAILGDVEGRVLVLTDRGAPNGQVVSIDPRNPQDIQVVAKESEHAVQWAHLAGDQIVVVRLARAQARLTLVHIGDTDERVVDLPSCSTVTFVEGDPAVPEAWLLVDRFEVPPEVLRLDARTSVARPLQLERSSSRPAHVQVTQETCRSLDGTEVDFFVVHPGTLGDRPRRTILYGYGGFNIPVTPRYSAAIHAWVEKGGLFVMANLRGGSERGQGWHEAGMRDRKERVFEDFIAVARWLVDNGYTTPDRLAIQGRSNGGLLVGACLVKEPALFGAALPAVGVLDMLRYHRFTVGGLWAEEYGTVDDESLFPILHRYSPLHNVRPGTAYPATMVSTADHDDRVVPAHSYKFAAALQEAQVGDAPVLLRVEESVGHGLGSPKRHMIARVVDEWTFLDAVLAP